VGQIVGRTYMTRLVVSVHFAKMHENGNSDDDGYDDDDDDATAATTTTNNNNNNNNVLRLHLREANSFLHKI
jgi:hypothetical protein